MLCAKYQEAGLCGSKEKCDRNFCDADTADDARRQKWSLYVASAKVGRRHNKLLIVTFV